jgi:hypothetical protein
MKIVRAAPSPVLAIVQRALLAELLGCCGGVS